MRRVCQPRSKRSCSGLEAALRRLLPHLLLLAALAGQIALLALRGRWGIAAWALVLEFALLALILGLAARLPRKLAGADRPSRRRWLVHAPWPQQRPCRRRLQLQVTRNAQAAVMMLESMRAAVGVTATAMHTVGVSAGAAAGAVAAAAAQSHLTLAPALPVVRGGDAAAAAAEMVIAISAGTAAVVAAATAIGATVARTEIEAAVAGVALAEIVVGTSAAAATAATMIEIAIAGGSAAAVAPIDAVEVNTERTADNAARKRRKLSLVGPECGSPSA